jgi:hypothetical protein
VVEAWRLSLNVHAHVAIPPGATTLAVPLTALLPPAPPPGRRAAPAPLGKLACVVSRPDFLSPEGPAAAPPGAGGAPDAAVTLRVIPAAAASAAHLRLIDEATGALLPLLHAGPPREQLHRRFSAVGRPAALAAPRARAPRADEPAAEEWGLDDPPAPPAPPPLHEAWFRLDIHRSRHGALQVCPASPPPHASSGRAKRGGKSAAPPRPARALRPASTPPDASRRRALGKGERLCKPPATPALTPLCRPRCCCCVLPPTTIQKGCATRFRAVQTGRAPLKPRTPRGHRRALRST